jgi:hypothetical protein
MLGDLYRLAERRAVRAELERVRQVAKAQLSEGGRRCTEADVDQFLLRNWYRLTEAVADMLWRAQERRDRRARRRE